MVYWNQMILNVSFNAKQITKMADVSLDLGKGLILGAFALPALAATSDFLTFLKLIVIGLGFLSIGIVIAK